MDFPQKVDIKTCTKKIPPHPCDPPPPCDPTKDPDGTCEEPFLCLERLKNPEDKIATRCKPGASIGVRACTKPVPPHPCDAKMPCKDIPPPKKLPCDEPPLCHEKIKNPEVLKLKRVLCTDSKGNVKEIILIKKD